MQQHVPLPLKVQAWDLPTRAFHWGLVALIVSAYVTSEYAESFGDHLLHWHRLNGVAILTLLVFRLLWGLVGSPTARFAHFLSSPLSAARYALDLVRARSKSYLGHNPVGAWMVIALLAVVALQAGLGLFATDDTGAAAGPLYKLVPGETVELLTKWHRRVFKRVLLPLIALHIIANVAYLLIKREPLIKAMITGTKPARIYADAPEYPVPAYPLARAALCLLAAALLTLTSLWLAAGRMF